MKNKKLSIAAIFFAVTIVAYILASVFFCYTTKPQVASGEFNFSITYEYKGETKTISGVYECVYSGSDTIHGEHTRYWEGEAKYNGRENPDNPNIVYESEDMLTTLYIYENMDAGYFMGDPLCSDYYQEQGLDKIEPVVQYSDYANDIVLDEWNKDEVLESIGFKFVDFTYDEPIENRFSFSGVMYEADNIVIFLVISLAFLVLCLIFVSKDADYQYTKLDKAGVVTNLLVGILALPIITVFCFFFGLVESNVAAINQILYNVPPVATICLALSIVLRRKGFSRTGFSIQFAGIVIFVLTLVADTLV